MSESFRLVFRGEVLAGQHQAVVKERLGALLKIDGERLDALFTGKAVTVRKEADGATAERFASAFKRAGARLRLVPIEAPEPVAQPPQQDAQPAGFALAERGARLQDPRAVESPAVDTSHLSLAEPGTRMSEQPTGSVPSAPDVSHLTIAAVGADIGLHKPPVAAPVDLDEIDFEVAPPGARMADAVADVPPPPPDTSHLQLK